MSRTAGLGSGPIQAGSYSQSQTGLGTQRGNLTLRRIYPLPVKWEQSMMQNFPAAALQSSPPAAGSESLAPIIEVRSLRKTYQTARGTLNLFHELDLEVAPGEMLAIVGQSGAGKSTLLHILGALDAPSAGTVYCASTNVAQLSSTAGSGVSQPGDRLCVAVPLSAAGVYGARKRSHAAVGRRQTEAGSAGRGRKLAAARWAWKIAPAHRPGELSGGEQQRVALARALVNNPRLLLADEPTGDLDEITAGRVFDLIERLHASHGLTSIVVTHNLDLAARCTRVLRLEGGRLSPARGGCANGNASGEVLNEKKHRFGLYLSLNS